MSKIYTKMDDVRKKFFPWVNPTHRFPDMVQNYLHILKPVIKGEGTGKRYFFKEANIMKLVHMYENNELDEEYKRPKDALYALEVHYSGILYWVKHYQSIIRYFRDPRHKHILNPVRYKKNGDNGKSPYRRVYVRKRDLEKFVQLYKEHKLKGVYYKN